MLAQFPDTVDCTLTVVVAPAINGHESNVVAAPNVVAELRFTTLLVEPVNVLLSVTPPVPDTVRVAVPAIVSAGPKLAGMDGDKAKLYPLGIVTETHPPSYITSDCTVMVPAIAGHVLNVTVPWKVVAVLMCNADVDPIVTVDPKITVPELSVTLLVPALVNTPLNVIVPLIGDTLIVPLIDNAGEMLIDTDGDTVRELPLGIDSVQLPVTDA